MLAHGKPKHSWNSSRHVRIANRRCSKKAKALYLPAMTGATFACKRRLGLPPQTRSAGSSMRQYYAQRIGDVIGVAKIFLLAKMLKNFD